jgi:chromosome partitioning protein
MKVISIINHKGGVGKSTITTNIAGYFANKEPTNKVILGDFDIQQSSRNWLTLRPSTVAKISPWEATEQGLTPPPEDTTHIIIDSPAGIREESLKSIISMSDKIVVPIRPSAFDMMSTEHFLHEMVDLINQDEREIELCVVGNMMDTRAKSSENLAIFIKQLGLESPANLRQTQIYVHLAENGLSLFDSDKQLFERDVEQWAQLIKWLEN